MSKFLGLIVPALALAFATLHSPQAEAARLVVVVGAPAKAPIAKVWIPGHWELRAGNRVWIDGHFKLAPADHHPMVPGHWELRAGKKVWVPAHPR